MSDAHDQLPVFLHLVDKIHGQHAAVKRLAELLCGSIQSTSKTVPLEFMNKSRFSTYFRMFCLVCLCVSSTDDGEQAGGEAGDEVLAGTSADDGVVCTRDGRPVIGCHHQTHLDELAGVARQPVETQQ